MPYVGAGAQRGRDLARVFFRDYCQKYGGMYTDAPDWMDCAYAIGWCEEHSTTLEELRRATGLPICSSTDKAPVEARDYYPKIEYLRSLIGRADKRLAALTAELLHVEDCAYMAGYAREGKQGGWRESPRAPVARDAKEAEERRTESAYIWLLEHRPDVICAPLTAHSRGRRPIRSARLAIRLSAREEAAARELARQQGSNIAEVLRQAFARNGATTPDGWPVPRSQRPRSSDSTRVFNVRFQYQEMQCMKHHAVRLGCRMCDLLPGLNATAKI
jgi:hypothetical protein